MNAQQGQPQLSIETGRGGRVRMPGSLRTIARKVELIRRSWLTNGIAS